MNRLVSIALAAAILAAAPVAAGADSVRMGDGSYVSRIVYGELKTADGRARLLAAVERSAERLCADVQPRRDRTDCAAQAVEAATRSALPQVGAAMRLASRERDAVQLASRERETVQLAAAR